MESPAVPALCGSANAKGRCAGPLEDVREQLIDQPSIDHRAARGAVTGMVLGAFLWGVILVLAGVIKL